MVKFDEVFSRFNVQYSFSLRIVREGPIQSIAQTVCVKVSNSLVTQ